jgi:integrase
VWAKKIRGRMHYFGPWSDPDGALARYLEQAEALHSGHAPRPESTTLTLKDLCNYFMTAKQQKVDAGELSPRTWLDYRRACADLLRGLGKTRRVSDLRPDDFTALRAAWAKRWGPTALGQAIRYTRMVFKYAHDAELIPTPIRLGMGFAPPSKRTLRLHRAQHGVKLFTAEEVRRLMDAADTSLQAMILLGVNCGFGNSDCGHLPHGALDLDGAILDYPRPKTGIPRRCPLWPETVEVIRAVLASRPAPRKQEHAGLLFLNSKGGPYYAENSSGPVSDLFGRLLRRLNINGRQGLGFYTLRHTFRTVADEARDQPAADYIMGHEVSHMSSVYRERISDDRLRAVTEHVRSWLFGVSGTAAAPEAPEA